MRCTSVRTSAVPHHRSAAPARALPQCHTSGRTSAAAHGSSGGTGRASQKGPSAARLRVWDAKRRFYITTPHMTAWSSQTARSSDPVVIATNNATSHPSFKWLPGRSARRPQNGLLIRPSHNKRRQTPQVPNGCLAVPHAGLGTACSSDPVVVATNTLPHHTPNSTRLPGGSTRRPRSSLLIVASRDPTQRATP